MKFGLETYFQLLLVVLVFGLASPRGARAGRLHHRPLSAKIVIISRHTARLTLSTNVELVLFKMIRCELKGCLRTKDPSGMNSYS